MSCRLGARPAANRLVHQLRRLATLLTQGLTNAGIAAHLHISPRTVGHHVAAILTKLQVPSRQAVADAIR